MSVNYYRPHVLLLPEDDANRQIANGFLLCPQVSYRQIQVLPVAGGWRVAVEQLVKQYAGRLVTNTLQHLILLIDFDEESSRLEEVQRRIPESIRDRVFVLGARGEPEDLRRANLGSFEEIGLGLARDCYERTDLFWGSNHLRHNNAELDRLRDTIRPILFPNG